MADYRAESEFQQPVGERVAAGFRDAHEIASRRHAGIAGAGQFGAVVLLAPPFGNPAIATSHQHEQQRRATGSRVLQDAQRFAG